MEEQVKVFKLANGEEIIAEVEKEEDGVYYCKCPFGIGINNEGRLVFVPYMQYTNAVNEIHLFKQHVMIATDPVESIYNDYMDATRKVIAPRRPGIIRPVN